MPRTPTMVIQAVSVPPGRSRRFTHGGGRCGGPGAPDSTLPGV